VAKAPEQSSRLISAMRVKNRLALQLRQRDEVARTG
jgi:hypothetical protein